MSKTNFGSVGTILTADFMNSLYGGLAGTLDAANLSVTDPRVIGHKHSGLNLDGHTSKIDLGADVTGQLFNANISDSAITKRNMSKYIDPLLAIPVSEIISGQTYYYINPNTLPGMLEPYLTIGPSSLLTNGRQINVLQGLTLIDNGPGASVDIDLSSTAVTPGVYTLSDITVDQNGRITAASNGVLPLIPSVSESYITISTATSLSNERVLTGSADISITDGGPGLPVTLSLAPTTVIAGTYNYSSITVDSNGRITSASSQTIPSFADPAESYITISSAPSLSGERTLAGSADISITDNGPGLSVLVSLVPTNVVAGTYNNASIVVDANGRISSASTGVAASNIFSTTANITSNSGGNQALDSFIIGSASLIGAGTRMQFDRTNGSFFVGTASAAQWDVRGSNSVGFGTNSSVGGNNSSILSGTDNSILSANNSSILSGTGSSILVVGNRSSDGTVVSGGLGVGLNKNSRVLSSDFVGKLGGSQYTEVVLAGRSGVGSFVSTPILLTSDTALDSGLLFDGNSSFRIEFSWISDLLDSAGVRYTISGSSFALIRVENAVATILGQGVLNGPIGDIGSMSLTITFVADLFGLINFSVVFNTFPAGTALGGNPAWVNGSPLVVGTAKVTQIISF